MKGTRAYILLALALLCFGSAKARSLTGRSDAGSEEVPKKDEQTKGGLDMSGLGLEGFNNHTLTVTRNLGPGYTETVTTTVSPDGTVIVTTTTTLVSVPSSKGKGHVTDQSSTPSQSFIFGNTPGSEWNPLEYLKQFGFRVPVSQGDKKTTPKESEQVTPEEPPTKDDDADDKKEKKTQPEEPKPEADECSANESTSEAVERCVNAVRRNPSLYAAMLPCEIPNYSSRPPLKVNPVLTTSAARHAADMASSRSVTHQGSDGSTLGIRIWERAGFEGSPIAENVAGGQYSARHVVFSWMCSSGHRKNIMSCTYDSMGTGIERNGRLYWVQNFGCTKYNSCEC